MNAEQQGLAAAAKVNEIVTVAATGPMPVELPPGPFIGFINDHNMRWVPIRERNRQGQRPAE